VYERALLATLVERLLEPRRFLQVLVGPRQVGKTTLVGQALERLAVTPGLSVHHVAADDVPAAGGAWLDAAWQTARVKRQVDGTEAGLLVVDEVQKVAGWSEVTKKNWDQDTRDRVPVKVLLTGSSRLLLQEGLGESLLGRFELHHLGHWSYTEMRDAFGFTPEDYVWFGAYPGAAPLIGDEARFKAYLTHAVVEASLNRDILLLTRIDKPALLRQLLEVGLAASGQIVSFTKLLGQLQDAGNTTTLARYLRLLDQAGLLAGLNKHSGQEIMTRGSIPKLQVHNTGLITAGRVESLASARSDPTLWGHLVENAVGAHLLAEVNRWPNARLEYWREGNAEVDFVLRHGDALVGVEVKSSGGRATTAGVAAFRRRFPHAGTIVLGGPGLDWQSVLTISVPDLMAAAT
jgi:predicted AAA+ superfamily ATPase